MDDAGSGPAGGPQRWALGWRRLVLATGMLVYPGVAAVGIGQYARGTAAGAGYGLVAAFGACYVLAAVAAVRRAVRTLWLLLAVMTALFVAVMPFAHEDAFFLCAVPVSMAAVFLRRFAGPALVAGALTCVLVPWLVPSWHTGPGWFEALAVVFTVLTVYAFAETAGTNRELMAARAEVARLASQAERDRIARDLHDLLGHSLTVITVKSALARRLAESGSPRSVTEITAVEELSRQALADVRAAVSGYREVTLAGELARGRELLRAAGIAADLPSAVDTVEPRHRELFGWVVREGLTNVVRHARAGRCTVTLAPSRVEITDDGPGGGVPGAGAAGGGNGLAGLAERVAAAGGRVEAGPAGPHGWRLRVSVGPPAGSPDGGGITGPPDGAAV